MVAKQLIVAVFLLGFTWAQYANRPYYGEDEARDHYEPSPTATVYLSGNVGKTIAALFKDKCMRNGGPDAFRTAEKGYQDLYTCMNGLMVHAELVMEVNDAYPKGKLNKVFKKYCDKKQQIKGCFKDALHAVKPCLTVAEEAKLEIVYNVGEQLAEFMCFKDGEIVTKFIAEGGSDCMQEKVKEVLACFKSTMNFDPITIGDGYLPNINFGLKECNQFSALRSCVVGKLGSCSQPTPATKFVDTLYTYIRQGTPCKSFFDPNKPGSASGLVVTSLTLIMAGATLLV